jgi:cell division protein FtsB
VARQLSSTQLKQIRTSPSIQLVLVIAVVLFILFLWLNFALTQEIESIGREIQEKTRELQAIERRQDSLLKEISETSSQLEMADKAWDLGYRPQTPVFLPVVEPLARATDGTMANQDWSLSAAAGVEGAAQQSLPLLVVLANQSRSLASVTEP